MTELFFEIKNLKKYFVINKGVFTSKKEYVKAVDDISVGIEKGKTLAIVGESGSGKTTLARTVLRLIKASEGEIIIDGENILNLKRAELRKKRSEISVVFQNPAASLNPQATVGESLMRPLIVKGINRKEAMAQAKFMLEKVKLDESYFYQYPYQLSGGQQQRVSIARALISKPKLLVLDEPTSALDISVQSQILNLLLDLQEEFELTYLFITHDLNVVRYMSDKVMVMYLGKVMEFGSVNQVFNEPTHPYTKGLISNMPILNPRARGIGKVALDGEVGSLLNVGDGCRLCNRCSNCENICEISAPPYVDIGKGHMVLCHKIKSI